MAEETKKENPIVKPGSPIGQLMDPNNPDSQMALLQLGMSLLSPQEAGTTFGQNAIGSIGDAFNYLQALEATRNEQQLAQRETAAQEQTADANAQLRLEQAEGVDRSLDQTDTANAIDLFNAQTERGKAEAVFQVGMQKAAAADNPIKEALIKGLMEIQKSKVDAGQPFDLEETMTMVNMIEADWNPTFDDFRWLDGRFVMNANLLEPPDPETGARPNNFIAVDPATIQALGVDPEQVKAQSEALLKAEEAKSVAEKSAESGVEPDTSNLGPKEVNEELKEAEEQIQTRVERIKELKASSDGNERSVAGIMETQGLTEDAAREKLGLK